MLSPLSSGGAASSPAGKASEEHSTDSSYDEEVINSEQQRKLDKEAQHDWLVKVGLMRWEARRAKQEAAAGATTADGI